MTCQAGAGRSAGEASAWIKQTKAARVAQKPSKVRAYGATRPKQTAWRLQRVPVVNRAWCCGITARANSALIWHTQRRSFPA